MLEGRPQRERGPKEGAVRLAVIMIALVAWHSYRLLGGATTCGPHRVLRQAGMRLVMSIDASMEQCSACIAAATKCQAPGGRHVWCPILGLILTRWRAVCDR